MKPRTVLLAGIAAVALPVAGALPTAALASPLPVAATYADLLEPVSDAGALLAADDANQAHLQLAQYYRGYRDRGREHHHHHHHSRRWYQSNGYYWHGGGWMMRPR